MDQLWEFESPPASGDDLAVMLPGLAYGCDRPLLAGVRDLLVAHGILVATLRFHYGSDVGFMARPAAEQIARIKADGAAILQAARRRAPGRLWLIGKSLGTISMAGMKAAGARHLWLTPSLYGAGLAPVMRARGGFCLVGGRDPARDRAVALHAPPHLEVAEVAGAHHGWEGAGDVLTPALTAVERWLDQARGQN